MRARMPYLMVLALLGCGDAATVGGTGTSTVTPVPGDMADPDGDGLSTESEEEGAVILVNTSGRPGVLEERRVTSDPASADTDGDGLDDHLERSIGTDPTRVDTDGDGLSDTDEVQRWGTSPVAVDTDGDATGLDGEGTAAPLPDLFDGAELRLEDDGGRTQPGPAATSPLLPDTDGDGASDHREFLSPTRQGHIAEAPILSIRPAPGTAIDAVLNVLENGSVVAGEGMEVSTTEADMTSTLLHSELAFETSAFVELAFGVNSNTNAGASADSIGIDTSLEAWGEVIAGGSARSAVTMGFDASHRNDATREFTTLNSEVSENGWSYDSGSLSVALELTNDGPLAFRVGGLGVTAFTIEPGQNLRKPLGELRPDDGTATTLAPGASMVSVVRNTALDATRMKELFQSTALHLAPAGYELLDADDLDFDFTLDAILERTTAIELDDGSGGVDRYFVATDIRRDPNGDLEPVVLADVLETAGLSATSNTAGATTLYTINGVDSEVYTGPGADFTGLDPTGYPLTGGLGDLNYVRAWFLFIVRPGSRPDDVLPGDVLQTMVGPGDRVLVSFTEDADHDGILASEELVHGSSDNSLDSDGDGLSDFWELRESIVVTTDLVSFEVGSSPASADSDFDGLSDLDEVVMGLSPLHADTDGDGYEDGFEREVEGLDPLRFDQISIPVADCIIDPASGLLNFSVSDAEGDFQNVHLSLAVQADADGNGLGCPADGDNIDALLTANFDPPLVAEWSSVDHGYPNFALTPGADNPWPVLHAAAPDLPWLGALPRTIETPDCTWSLSDLDLILDVTVTDHQGHSSSIQCAVSTGGTP